MSAEDLLRSISPTPACWQANLSVLSFLSRGVGAIKSLALSPWTTGGQSYVQIRISFRGNRPPGRLRFSTTIGRTAGGQPHVREREFKGGITHEKTRHPNHPQDAPAGKDQYRNLPGPGHPIQHHPRSCSPPSGILRRQALPELRTDHGAADRTESKALLLR